MPMRAAIVRGLLATVCLLVLALRPTSAAAGCADKIDLFPTSDGEAVDARGLAYLRSDEAGAKQNFTVAVDVAVPEGCQRFGVATLVAVPEGTQLFVFANETPVGTITIAPGVTTLDVSNADGVRFLPGVDSVCSIGRVSVTDEAGTPLLVGSSADF